MKSNTAHSIRKHIENNDPIGGGELLDGNPVALGLSTFDYTYLRAKKYLCAADYLTASQLLRTLSNSLNLEVLSDLTLCYYQLGLTPEYASTLSLLKEQYDSQINRLGPQEKINVAILLSKFYEENGDPELSLEILESVDKDEPYTNKAILIQRLRLFSTLGRISEVKEIYKLIVAGDRHTQNFEIEREHALLLADNLLLGVSAVVERFDYLATLNLSEVDKSFLYCEIAEILILKDQVQKLRTMEVPVSTGSEYERYLLTIIRKFILGELLPDLNPSQFEKRLSPVSLVRILRLYRKLHPQVHQGVQQRFQLALTQLPSRSLRTVFGETHYGVSAEQVVVNFDNKTVSCNGANVKIKNKFFWSLTAAMLKQWKSGQEVLSVSQAVAVIYDEMESAQHYDRLRVAISRLNKELSIAMGLSEMFRLSKSSIVCNFQIREGNYE